MFAGVMAACVVPDAIGAALLERRNPATVLAPVRV
jgi:hypothetical protein